MKTKTSLIIITGLIIASFAVSFYYYPQLPERIASHWNAKGQVDDTMGKEVGAFIMPAIMAITAAIFLVILQIDPLKKNIEKFKSYYFGFIIAECLLLFCLHCWMMLWNVGIKMSPNVIMPIVIGPLFFFMGYIMKNIKRNWFIGIRTPWTLSNETVWKRTHEISGKLFMGSGVIATSGVFFPEYSIWLIIVPVLTVAAISIVYSYVVFRQVTGTESDGTADEMQVSEGSGDTTWDNIKEGYLYQVEKCLMKVKHPAKKQVLEDVASHLDQKYAELGEDDKTWEGYQQIITEMGPAEDYAELLNGESPVAISGKSKSWLFYFLIFDFIAVALVFIFIVMPHFSGESNKRASVDSETFLENFDEKLAGFDIDNAHLEDVINTFGYPIRYIWGQETFDPPELPIRYIMQYPADFNVFMSECKVVEVRHEGPGTNYAFMGKIKVGTPLEEVLDVFGMPDETVEGKENQFRDNVLYMDIEGNKGHCYYGRSESDARLWFLDYEVIAIYTTRSDYGEDRPSGSSKELNDRKRSVIEKLSIYDIVLGDIELKPYPDIEKAYSAVIAIKNTGSTVSPRLDVIYKINNNKKMHHNAGPIKAGESWREGSMPFVVEDGENEILVTINPENSVSSEYLEGKHYKKLKFHVRDGEIVK